MRHHYIAILLMLGLALATLRWGSGLRSIARLTLLLVIAMGLTLRLNPLSSGGVRWDMVPRIDAASALKAVTEGQAVLVDARHPKVFEQGHLRGAISMMYADLRTRLGELPRNKTLIVYCS
ncbi:MAG: hypothetical protein EB084_14910 [Proteobacteria bacterium]|nr:hypothetical protein [Pseudomonadota bacterium]